MPCKIRRCALLRTGYFPSGMAAKLPPHHRLLTMICLGFTALVTLFYLKGWGLNLEDTERASRDWLLTNKAARRSPQNPRIVFLSIDENTLSLDSLFAEDLEKSPTLRLMKQGFPWNREVYANIIDRLADAGASAILFDLIFPSPREGDDAFRAAKDRHGDKVVIGSNFILQGEDTSAQAVDSTSRTYVLPTKELQPPPNAASWVGFVNVHPDGDDLVRHVYFRTTFQEFFLLKPIAHAEELFSLGARGLEKAGFTKFSSTPFGKRHPTTMANSSAARSSSSAQPGAPPRIVRRRPSAPWSARKSISMLSMPH